MEEKGIKFTIVSKEEAKSFLLESNYYFKLKSFAKNYEKYLKDPNKGKYISLEFAYLKELAVLDMRLRKILFSMTSDIEHFLKVELLNACSENPQENGYDIVSEFLNKWEYITPTITKKCNDSATSDLVKKYCDNWAIWNIVEILSFGDFIKLYEFYFSKYPNEGTILKYLGSVRFLRNAAAHNNCILNSLRKPYLLNICQRSVCVNPERFISNRPFLQTVSLTKEIEKIQNDIKITIDIRKKMLRNPVVHDLTALFLIHPQICSRGVVNATKSELRNFFDDRVGRHREYFDRNQPIKESLNYLKKIVDYYYP